MATDNKAVAKNWSRHRLLETHLAVSFDKSRGLESSHDGSRMVEHIVFSHTVWEKRTDSRELSSELDTQTMTCIVDTYTKYTIKHKNQNKQKSLSPQRSSPFSEDLTNQASLS